MDCESCSMPSSEYGNVPKSYNLKAAEFPSDIVGLNEEELKIYRNTPFWRMIRYAAFGAFWGVFVAMLGGAIAIILIEKL
ncbi:hypothetical protein QR680_002263 [Steinernema hermaphroditum]|uniref:Solute carrier family 3 member 2 N-terminal domain-containing protein n=1 Tax=Steinernema hermaphroditum TaxID=289476 RepID=A0AA39LHX2_9BILA|nr:hypothetical protein QR680_002263 [Steinernema hermaphroditum]